MTDKCQIESWCPGVPVACQKHVDQANVELDKLRKDLELAIAERDLERHQKEMRHEAYLEAKQMLKTANEREQLQIEAANGWRKFAEDLVTETKLRSLSAAFIERWKNILEPPTPMCQDPVDGAGEGRPT
jgi:ribosomal protein L44E